MQNESQDHKTKGYLTDILLIIIVGIFITIITACCLKWKGRYLFYGCETQLKLVTFVLFVYLAVRLSNRWLKKRKTIVKRITVIITACGVTLVVMALNNMWHIIEDISRLGWVDSIKLIPDPKT